MKTVIYHNPRCSKSRQGLEILKEIGADFEVVEYLNAPLSAEDLRQIINKLGIEPVDMIRKNEQDYKDRFKAKNMDHEAWISAMVQYPKLIERPIVVSGNKAVIGRPPENIRSLF